MSVKVQEAGSCHNINKISQHG